MSGHLDGPPPGPPDPPYIPGDLGAPSAEEFARRRASSEPRPENPYRMDADSAAADSPLAPVFDEGVAAVLAALESNEVRDVGAKALLASSANLAEPFFEDWDTAATDCLSAVVVHLRGGTDPPAQA